MKYLLQDLIKTNSFWNEEIGEWELRCVAYTGNNMAKELPNEEEIIFEVSYKKNVLKNIICLQLFKYIIVLFIKY